MTQPNDPNTPPPAQPSPMAAVTASNAYTGPAPDKDATTMGMLCHLLAIFTGFLGPLIIWLIKKEQHPFIDDQGKEALNFQIACFIGFLICIPLNFVFCIGIVIGAALMIARIIFCILATLQANKGVAYRYPLNLRLIK